MSLGRRVRITLGLVGASGLIGGLCAVLALLPVLILRIVRPSADDAFVSLSEIAPLAFGFGAILGAFLGPVVAWTALRHVPLWRLLLEPAVGTVLGALIAWVFQRTPLPLGIPSLVLYPLVGMGIAAIRLRRAIPMRVADMSSPALSNER
jgi:hypothetical protein